MGLLSKIEKAIFGSSDTENRSQTIDDKVNQSLAIGNGGGLSLPFGNGGLFYENNSMELSAVFRAVDTLSNSVAQLPLNVLKVGSDGFKKPYREHYLYKLLNRNPNDRISAFQLKKMMVQSMILRGNGYCWIERKGKQIKALHFIPSEYVTIDDNSLNYLDKPVSYNIVGIDKPVSHKDIIHIQNISYDGINGISTLKFAFNTLKTAFASEQSALNYFESGCCVGGILKVQGYLDTEQKAEMKRTWQNSLSNSGGLNGLAVLEGGMDYQHIGSNGADSQLLETRHFNVDEIGRFFNLSPIKLGDYEHNSYSTLEMVNLSFLTDTLQPILAKIEAEFERKLFADETDIEVRFDVNQLLRTDKASQANYFNTLFQIGVMSQNEIRKELDLPKLENGDQTFVQVNVQTLEKATSENPADSQDIKLKLND